MTTEEILIAAGAVLAVLIVLALVAWLVSSRRRKRRERLQRRYGREYDETVGEKGRRAGVDDLDSREQERRDFDLREVDERTRADLRERMVELQFRFVEEPHETMLELQRVVVDGLRARGYPIAEDPERSLRLLSVDHPDETPALRALLKGSYGRDLGVMRELFLDARKALTDVVAVTYSRRDLDARDATRTTTRPEPEARVEDDHERPRAGEPLPPAPQ